MNTQPLLLQEIEQEQNFPVLPQDISYLLKILNDDDIGYTELAEALEKYPSIAIKIVATANSAWASPGTPITTLRDSCARIGVQIVRSIAIALSIAQVFDPAKCPAFDCKTFWISALLTAEAAHICARNTQDVPPDTARLAGLFHNIGLLWLANQKPVETASAISLKQSNENYRLSEALTEQLGMDPYTAGGHLASYIELPDIIAKVIASPSADSNDDEPLIDNHINARQLASSVLLMANADNKEVENMDDNPYYEQLSNKLPGIQSLAQALFFG